MADPRLELRLGWQRHVAPEAHGRFEALLERYHEPHRRYHTATHVAWVIRHARTLAASEPVDDLDAVVAAALFHDAVYDPTSTTNEAASADLARRVLDGPGWTAERIERVASMIEGTARHRDPPDHDTAVLFDADLAVLGADPATYGDYVTQVRAEYGHVDDARWVVGRRSVLESFAARERIYATSAAASAWEERARANLAAELAAMRSAST